MSVRPAVETTSDRNHRQGDGTAPAVAPDVYLPIEIVKREYAGHLLLAVALASRGMNVVIGHKSNGVNKIAGMARRPGIVFYKSSLRDTYGRKGFISVGQDPETGLPYSDYDYFYRRRPELAGFGTSQAYFCYGTADYEFLKRVHPEASGALVLSGSPRAQMWGELGEAFYEPQVQEIRERYGKFVLFCSSEHRGNPRNKQRLEDQAITLARTVSPLLGSGADAREFAREQIEQSRVISRSFLEAAIRVAEESEFAVIIRPHPGEDWRPFSEAAAKCERLFVDAAYDLSAWVRAAHAVVQNGSTSAIESWAAGTPTVAYGQTHDEVEGGLKALMDVPNRLSLKVIGIQALLDVLPVVKDEWNGLRNSGAFDFFEARLHEPEAGAHSVISDHIRAMVDDTSDSGVVRRWDLRLQMLRLKMALLQLSTRTERLGKGEAIRDKRRTIPRKQIVRDVEVLLELLNIKTRIRVSKLSYSCFLLSRQGPSAATSFAVRDEIHA